MKTEIALEPRRVPAYQEAIESVGAVVVPLSAAIEAMVWTDYADPAGLKQVLANNPQLKWVQLPFAGVDAFHEVLQHSIVFTSAKRSYSEPVAEHALALCLALGRIIPERVREKSWGRQFADSLFDEEVLIIGGGGIAEQLVQLLAPFRSEVTVIRKHPDAPFVPGFQGRVLGFDQFQTELAKAKFVVLACALTFETQHLFDSRAFKLMRADSYLVNVARGMVINQDDLVDALNNGEIAAAAVDVTYPEPLPEEHAMWGLDNLLITPHSADTLEIVTRLFSQRLRENVSAWLDGSELIGVVDKKLGY
ncbi:D-isomer specific 2-hydroxyacid dehydrogenase family protein [Candidatus Aquiluna sp. UB-MaderosW2red]|uniref:D-isomer specific 2-hydroxyacid dehydrogenase family protein n=1 Tax=Candidatus Aquiluna sp. UB-MaderosW2red TaxID=1855377 RepID=UPI000875D39A|nr:D-isomer specific 2-hydroxyacid dehydrogenase family protein [Candidatus Aquiluna sp. UB-MaderosW2red]SCX14465.1 Phosphoglycerate dehydrogenase [Candidatus Aquiluna sp. UB-MaderosW2red]